MLTKRLCPDCDGTGWVYPIVDEEDLGQAPGSAREVCRSCMPPTFGQRIRNPAASIFNPHCDGYYVETIVRTGRANKGRWWRLTDGHGVFWEIPAVHA